jgi:hypothetical protein
MAPTRQMISRVARLPGIRVAGLIALAAVAAGVVISALGGAVSGHTLKHLAAAMGAYWIARTIRRNAGGDIESGDHAVS